MAGKFCTTLHAIVKFLIPTYLIANLKSDQLIFNDHLCAIKDGQKRYVPMGKRVQNKNEKSFSLKDCTKYARKAASRATATLRSQIEGYTRLLVLKNLFILTIVFHVINQLGNSYS